jgi:sugar (pentulose or hexulose) kinase
MDHEAGYLSASGISSRPLLCSLGTAWVGNYVLRSGAPPDWGMNLVLPSPVGKGKLVLRVMLAGDASWEWALRRFVGEASPRGYRRAEEIFRQALLPLGGLVGLPWLTRRNPAAPDHPGAGGFFGVTPLTTGADLLRALAAGMCFELARLLKPVVDAGDCDAVALSGGAANSPHFRTLLTGLFHPMPVMRVQDDFAGARGTLHALNRGTVCVRTRRLSAPPRRVRQSIQAGFENYRRFCGVLRRGLGGDAGLCLGGDDKEKRR